MITLIGTSHILNLREELSEIFKRMQPDTICIELDKIRYEIINKIPNKYHKNTDMIVASDYAKNNHIPLNLIDKQRSRRFNNIFQHLSKSEKILLSLKFMSFIIFGLLFPYILIYYSNRNYVRCLNKYINEGKIEQQSKSKFNIILKKYLLDEREKYMSEKLENIDMKFNNIIAVIGDRHIYGISKILNEKGLNYNAIHLKEYVKKPITIKSLARTNEISIIFSTIVVFSLIFFTISSLLLKLYPLIIVSYMLFLMFIILSTLIEKNILILKDF